MDVAERVDRMRRMRRSVTEHNIYWWAASLIGELCELRLRGGALARVRGTKMETRRP
jgi:trehalose-6-phosphate synthase